MLGTKYMVFIRAPTNPAMKAAFFLLLQQTRFVVDHRQFYRKRFAPGSFNGQNLTPCRFSKDRLLQPRIAARDKSICEEP